ncbi:hypothetical protein B0H16DRAFT_1732261 [Mycena metata]|uniref:Uncharacterized protein n=1 Tax=Mycena metata TaxID=1033252 RepID=A0AAD7MUD3_9AGAR|nr:hypothetical protein B0H16DRAFT_1732261 [Mycena metata]
MSGRKSPTCPAIILGRLSNLPSTRVLHDVAFDAPLAPRLKARPSVTDTITCVRTLAEDSAVISPVPSRVVLSSGHRERNDPRFLGRVRIYTRYGVYPITPVFSALTDPPSSLTLGTAIFGRKAKYGNGIASFGFCLDGFRSRFSLFLAQAEGAWC